MGNERKSPASATILAFPPAKPRVRADVPPFDPTNPAHLRAWEAIFDFGRASLKWEADHGRA